MDKSDRELLEWAKREKAKKRAYYLRRRHEEVEDYIARIGKAAKASLRS